MKRGETIWFVAVKQSFAGAWRYEIKAKLARVAMSRALARFQRDAKVRLGGGWDFSLNATSRKPASWQAGQARGW